MIALAPLVDGPWLSFGDYNLIRYPSEKNNHNFDRGLAAEFNSLIRDMGWFELDLRDRRYTWTNGQEVPVLARLDRAFFNTPWNSTFPTSLLASLPRPTSDHHPLVVSAVTKIPSSSQFRFENAWLLDPSFLSTTLPHWSSVGVTRGAVLDLATCIKRFRTAAKV
jgi:hypothetical protein